MVTFLRLAARFWPVLTLVSLIFLTWASLQPPGTALGDPNPYDKLLHLAAYGAVAGPLGLAWPRRVWLFLGTLVLWGAGIELVQPLVGREGHWGDLLANLAGLSLGGVVGWALGRFVPGVRRGPDI